MKYLNILFVLLLGITACDKIPDGVIDIENVDSKVKNFDAPSAFIFSGTDSLFVTKVEFQNSTSIRNVWAAVKSIDGRLTVSSQTILLDDGNNQVSGDQVKGDNIYSAKIAMGSKKPSGKYYIDYFVEDNINIAPNNVTKIVSHVFDYTNNSVQENYPPVISNLVMASAFNIEETYVFTVKADDANGLFDIKEVFFKVYQPDGILIMDTKNGRDYFKMDDSGNSQTYGDANANDGIYSFKITFHDVAMRGKWHFEFQARDKKGVSSNKIEHDVSIK